MGAMTTVATMMTPTIWRQRACKGGDDGGDGGDDGNGCVTAAMVVADDADGAVCFLLAGWTGCLARQRTDGMSFFPRRGQVGTSRSVRTSLLLLLYRLARLRSDGKYSNATLWNT